MATQTQVIRGNGVGLVGRLAAGRSRISESFTEFFAELAAFKALMAWGLRQGIKEDQLMAYSIQLSGRPW